MARPRKIIPPVKGGWLGILTEMADNKGAKKNRPKELKAGNAQKLKKP